jgi:hypothetical protein
VIGLWPDRGFHNEFEDRYPVCFVKTHSEDHSTYPTIHIVRDGRDAIVSEAHYAKRGTMVYGKHSTMHLMGILADGNGPWSWSHHCRTYSERNVPTVRVHYEALIRNPVKPIIEAVRTLGLPIKPKSGPYRLQSFDELRSMNPEFYRRGIAGSWRTEMSAGVQARFWNAHGEMMEQMGYQCEEAMCLTT